MLRSAAWMMMLVITVLGSSGARAAAPTRPNIVIVLADDLGFSDRGCYGGEIQTPNLDALARNGLRFTQFTNTARCWPSRAALLSGYYAQQVNRDPGRTRPRWAALLPDLLKPAGYVSYHSGKWHVDGPVRVAGFVRSYLVVDQDRHFGPRNHQLDDRPLPTPKPEEGYYAPVAIADRAIEWLDEHRAKHPDAPFFLYLAFTTPHFPLQARSDDIDRYRDRYLAGWDKIRAERWRRIQANGIAGGMLSAPERDVVPSWNVKEPELKARIGDQEVGHAVPWSELTDEQRRFQATKMAIHAAMIDRLDRETGRVIDRLRTAGLLDNTLILFASDNGASAEQIIRGDGHDRSASPGSAASYLGLGPGWSTVSNTPFRRHKSWVHEGGIATPFLVHWPSGISARGELRHAPAHLVDVVPTLLELVGLTAPASWNGHDRPELPGRSLVPFFARDDRAPHSPIYYHHEGNRGLRSGDWKLVAAGPEARWELYNLAEDRTETVNLASKHPEIVERLAREWTALDERYRKQGLSAPANPAATRKAARKKAAPSH